MLNKIISKLLSKTKCSTVILRLTFTSRRVTVLQDRSIDIWTRPVEPVHHGNYSYAVAFVSRREDGAPYLYKITLEDLGLKHHFGYTIKVIINYY